MSWRDRAEPIIAEVLQRTKGQPKEVITKSLRDAYPFGERKYHPYKIWLSEIKRQTGRRSESIPASAYARLIEWEAIYGRRES